MILLRLAGVIRDEDLQRECERPEVAEALTRAAVGFVRAGGTVTAAEWAGLIPAERAAFIAARRAYDAELIFMRVIAGASPAGAAAVVAPADGGAMRDGQRLDDAIERVVGAAARGPS